MKYTRLGWLSSISRAGTKAFTMGLEELGAAILVIMTLLVTIEAIGRTAFGFSTGFTYEMIAAFTGCLGFIGLAATFKKGAHIRILAFLTRVPEKPRYILDVTAHVLVLIFTCFLLRYAAPFAFRSLEQNEKSWAALPFPIYPFKLMIPIGLLALVTVISVQIYALVFKSKQGIEEQRLSD